MRNTQCVHREEVDRAVSTAMALFDAANLIEEQRIEVQQREAKQQRYVAYLFSTSTYMGWRVVWFGRLGFLACAFSVLYPVLYFDVFFAVPRPRLLFPWPVLFLYETCKNKQDACDYCGLPRVVKYAWCLESAIRNE